MQLTPHADIWQIIPEKLEEFGYCSLDLALPEQLSQDLYQRVTSLQQHDFSSAGIGRKHHLHQDNSFRSDKIHWLESSSPAEHSYLLWMEKLRLTINQRLFMGLFDYEAHFAHYAVGAHYKRHLDAFQGSTNRVLSTVFYLNPQWQEEDGGELLMYKNETSQAVLQRITPKMGTLLIFLSGQFPHEVLTAHRNRYSIAGWFRVKTMR